MTMREVVHQGKVKGIAVYSARSNTVYMPAPGSKYENESSFVHELVHVFQHQQAGYKLGHWKKLFREYKRYDNDWRSAIDQGKGWKDLGMEQQAWFIQTAFKFGCFTDKPQAFDTDARASAVLKEAMADFAAAADRLNPKPQASARRSADAPIEAVDASRAYGTV
jgi:hypothetical protein